MTKRKTSLAFLSMLIAVILVFSPVLAATGNAKLISTNASGIVGSSLSYWPSISDNGQFVAFASFSDNLVAGDTNSVFDVFRKNRVTNAIELVSISTGGVMGDSGSSEPSISSDGRYIGFISHTSNFSALDTNGAEDVFLRDMQMNTTTLVSVNSAGSASGNGVSEKISISADGRYAVFQSSASDLVVGDTNSNVDIFLRDLLTSTTSLISSGTGGTPSDGDSLSPVISSNGRYIVYYSDAENLVVNDTNACQDIFRYDRQTTLTERVSVDSGGTQATDASIKPAVSSNGRFVSFISVADNLVADDTNGAYDVFVKDMLTLNTNLVSKNSQGIQGNSTSDLPSISPDGRYVSFASNATNLVLGDTNGNTDIFVHDRSSGRTSRVSVGSGGAQANGSSTNNDISSSGQYIVFESNASNLSPIDTNGLTDIFLNNLSRGSAPDPEDDSDPIKIPATGFAPGRITSIASQPMAKQYTAEDIVLKIPELNIQSPILDVPQIDGDWDVAWLENNIGYLEGTAFPTWEGNSVLTGHSYDSFGQPGPFVNLETLKWGDRIIINAWGQDYIYEVRTVDAWVDPKDTRLLTKHEDLPWLTLVTCKGFDEKSDTYRWRTVVRAVQVSVK